MTWTDWGLDAGDALRVVLSSAIFYAVVVLIVRMLGPRTLASLSSFDLAALIALGAIIGRSILGDTPTVAAGMLGILTLLVLQALTGQLRRGRRGAALVSRKAVVLMAGDELQDDLLRREHVVHEEVASRLRQAGIRTPQEVACVILEPTGQMSVLRRGEPIEASLLRDVRGADRIPATLRAADAGDQR